MNTQLRLLPLLGFIAIFLVNCSPQKSENSDEFVTISKEVLKDKIKGAWAAQTIGVTYGGPTEFRFNKRMIPDSIEIQWADTLMYHWMTRIPGLYDDIYMDLTFVEVMEKEGIDAPALLMHQLMPMPNTGCGMPTNREDTIFSMA